MSEGKEGRTAIVIAVLSLVISIVALFKPAPMQEWIDDRFAAFFVPNDDDIPISAQRIEILTSGYLVDNDGDIWSGNDLVDNDPKTAWSECGTRDKALLTTELRYPCEESGPEADLAERCLNPELFASDPVTQGIGEWVEFTFPAETQLKAVYIRNGNQQSDQTFLRNPRVARLSVHADGEPLQDLELRDGKEPQRFDVKSRATTIRLTIEETYLGRCIPGKRAGNQLDYFYDASLAEVSFIPANIPNSGPN